MKRKDKYPMIRCLLAAQFNQDWNLDYSCSEEAISDFIKNDSKKHGQQMISELKTLFKEEHTFKEWENIVYDDFGCEYYFDYEDDYTPKEFLEKILKQFEEELPLVKDD